MLVLLLFSLLLTVLSMVKFDCFLLFVILSHSLPSLQLSLYGSLLFLLQCAVGTNSYKRRL